MKRHMAWPWKTANGRWRTCVRVCSPLAPGSQHRIFHFQVCQIQWISCSAWKMSRCRSSNTTTNQTSTQPESHQIKPPVPHESQFFRNQFVSLTKFQNRKKNVDFIRVFVCVSDIFCTSAHQNSYEARTAMLKHTAAEPNGASTGPPHHHTQPRARYNPI